MGYGFLGRQSEIRGHGKVEGLTVSRLEGNAASGKALRLVVDGGRELERERESAVEVESEENEAKIVKWRYLRARASVADPRDSSATGLGLGEGEFAGGGSSR